MKNKKRAAIKIAAGIFAAAALLLAGCKDNDNFKDGPMNVDVSLSTTWDNTNLTEAPEAGYMVLAGDYRATVKREPVLLRNLLPGKYTGYFYTAADKITVSSSAANTLASVASTATPAGQRGIFVASKPGFFYSGTKSLDIEKNKRYDITVPMNQQVKELSIIIRPDGGVAGLVTGVTANISGIAGKWDLDSGQPHDNPVNVNTSFTRDGDNWIATVRLLGITGATQVMSGVITFSDNLDPVTFSRNLRSVPGFLNFNLTKKLPLGIEAQLVNVHDEFSLGDFEEIPGWTGIDEDVNGETRSYQVAGSTSDLLTSNALQDVTVKVRAGTGVESGDYFTVGGTAISAMTNASGQFSLSLPNGNYTLEFALDGYETMFKNITVNRSSVSTGALKLSVTRYLVSGTISNTVSAGDVEGAVIKVREGHGQVDSDLYSPGGSVLSATSDEEGKYSLALPDGDYTLAIALEGYLTVFLNVTVAQGDVSGADAEIGAPAVMDPDGYNASGWVGNESSGKALAYVYVKVRSGADATAGDYMQFGGKDVVVQSGDDGKYTVKLPDGTYTLEFSRAGYAAKYMNVTISGAAKQLSDIKLDIAGAGSGVIDWTDTGGLILHR